MNRIKFTIEDGNVLNFNNFYLSLSNGLDALKDGQHEIVFDKPKRTIGQHKLMWLWFNCLAEDTGSTSLELYEYFCLKYNYHYCSYDEKGKFSGGTSQLKTKSFSRFLNHIQAEALVEFHNILPCLDNDYLDLFVTENE